MRKRKCYVRDLCSLGIVYFASQRVKDPDTGERGTRYVLDTPLTWDQKTALWNYSNVFISSCRHRYAPEIRHDTIILFDKCRKQVNA